MLGVEGLYPKVLYPKRCHSSMYLMVDCDIIGAEWRTCRLRAKLLSTVASLDKVSFFGPEPTNQYYSWLLKSQLSANRECEFTSRCGMCDSLCLAAS